MSGVIREPKATSEVRIGNSPSIPATPEAGRAVNMKIYAALREPPQEALKKITGGRLNGFTDINPMWRIRAMTEVFGPCGLGWKVVEIARWTDSVPGIDAINANIKVAVTYRLPDGTWSEPLEGTGGSKLVSVERGGAYLDDEAWKKATTDAIGSALKLLGCAADVYWQNDRTKYTQVSGLPDKPAGAPAKPAPKPAPAAPAAAGAASEPAPKDEASEQKKAAWGLLARSTGLSNERLTNIRYTLMTQGKIPNLGSDAMTIEQFEAMCAKILDEANVQAAAVGA